MQENQRPEIRPHTHAESYTHFSRWLAEKELCHSAAVHIVKETVVPHLASAVIDISLQPVDC